MVTVPESLDAKEVEVEIVAGFGKGEDVQGGNKGAKKNGANGVLDIGHGSSRLRGAARRAKGQEEEEGEINWEQSCDGRSAVSKRGTRIRRHGNIPGHPASRARYDIHHIGRLSKCLGARRASFRC